MSKQQAVKPTYTTNRPRVLRPTEAAELLGIGRSTLWRYAQRQGFPCKIRLGEGASGWLENEILAWVESCKVEV